jgi:hypothetical protein
MFCVTLIPHRDFPKLTTLVEQIQTIQISVQTWINLRQNYGTFYPTLMEANFETLSCLVLNLGIYDEVDCSVFEKCKSLRLLGMHARPKSQTSFNTTNVRDFPAKSELINIGSLPKSLICLLINNFFLEGEDAEILTTAAFPNLKELYLLQIGEKADLGISLDLFSRLSTTLTILHVQRGFNLKRLQEDLRSEDGARAFTSIAILNDQERDELGIPYMKFDEEAEEQLLTTGKLLTFSGRPFTVEQLNEWEKHLK